MDATLVYVTTASRDEAETIGRTLVTEDLAACANIIDGMVSIYRWQGGIEQSHEAVLLLKTTGHRVAALTTRIKALHSYDIPCIVALPIIGGNPEFLAWISSACEER